MESALIVPLSMMDRTENFDYHMILPQMATNEQYYNFYANVEGFKILDNGAAEGHWIRSEDLLYLAWNLQVDEVIAPDVLGDMSATLRLLKGFMYVGQSYRVMAVLHAETWKEFNTIFNAAIDLNVVSVALPRMLAETLGPMARLRGAELIRKYSPIPIHALGCTNRIVEALDLKHQGIVRGIDSSAPVVLGLQGRDLAQTYTTKRPKDFFDLPETPQALRNLNLFRRWCST
jgi:hypothetical protein